ncbi:MAG: DUF2851 family protein [Bacteroidetes bacterium]|nr:DUF2851 family protein [Bacteroidota bacterium]MCL5025653.1 DUF2851 family protein [Chloroflexota bacterium]
MPHEHYLCLRWSQRRYGAASLQTTGGQPLGVVYPGRWCRTPGPDFRDAVLVINDEICHGDVEVHNCASAWRGHGHHLQSAYNRVVLQVVLEMDSGEDAYTEDGRRVPTVQLGPYPIDTGYLPPPTCPEAAAQWDVPSLAACVERLGQDRVLGRAARLEAEMALQPPDQVLYEALCEALGYNRNPAPFRELARRLPLAVLEAAVCGRPAAERSTLLAALLLGQSGLLPSQRPIAGDRIEGSGPRSGYSYSSGAEQTWRTLSARWELEPLSWRAWRFAQVRPENWPTRRVAAAAWIVGRHLERGLLETICAAVQAGPAALEKELVGGSEMPYWETHYDFGRPKRSSHLIGRARGGELAVNAAIPMAYAWGQRQDDAALCEAALSTLRWYPGRGENELTRYVRREVLQTAFPQTACRQQGLLHLYHRWCREKDCDECPISVGLD